jgi:hypothetical protein
MPNLRSASPSETVPNLADQITALEQRIEQLKGTRKRATFLRWCSSQLPETRALAEHRLVFYLILFAACLFMVGGGAVLIERFWDRPAGLIIGTLLAVTPAVIWIWYRRERPGLETLLNASVDAAIGDLGIRLAKARRDDARVLLLPMPPTAEPFTSPCPRCRQPIMYDLRWAGQDTLCPVCGCRLRFPSPSAPLPEQQPAAFSTAAPPLTSAPPVARALQQSTRPFAFEPPSYDECDYQHSRLRRGYACDEYDEESRYRRGRRRSQGGSPAGSVCSILSVIFGCIAFLACPPFFGIAGFILGVIGTCLSENKVTGILGIILSVIGGIVGMFLGALVALSLYR